MSETAINARISELVGLGLVDMTMREDVYDHNTTAAPTYKLNLERVIKILNQDGQL